MLLSEWIYREAKDQTTTTPSTLNCDTPNQRKMDKSPGSKQFGGAAGRPAVDNMNEQEENRPSIKFQLFSSNKDSIGNHQSSRNLMNNKNHNNNNNNNSNSVYNATTTTGTVLNGPSKLFRIPNLVRK